MRLQSLRAHNYLNLRAKVIEIPAAANAVVLAGPNGSGKSALLDGIRLVLSGDLPRGLGYKKDLPSLITEGEKDGWFGATAVNREGRATEFKVSFKTGAAAVPPPYADSSAGLAVSPQDFMALDPNKRRRALFDLNGISLTKSAITEALVKDGHDAARVEKVATALGGGFDAAAKRAKELASEARGAWQATTGENYGAQKAVGWKAEVPAFDESGDPEAITGQLVEKQAEVVQATRKRDTAQRDEQQHQTAVGAQKLAAELGKREAAVATLDEQLEAAIAKHEKMRAAAASSGGWTCACPSCGVMLKSQKPGQLEEYDPAAPTGPRAAAAAEAASAEVQDLRGQRAAAQKKVDEARAAKLMLERLPPRPSAEELSQYEAEARRLLDEQRLLETELETAKAARSAEAVAARRTDDATRYHADVEGYTALSAAIEALPAKYLDETLRLVNDALDKVSRSFKERVVLGADMELRYGTVPYRLLSESQQWRAELALGIALAAHSGAVVLMDRFDMVQPSDRGAILQMLGAQNAAQVIIGATLKQAPEFPAESGLFAYWLG